MTCKALVTSFTLLGSETCWRQPDLEDQRPAHALDAMAWVIGLPEHPQIERERPANVLQQGFGIGLQSQPGDKALDARVSAMGSRSGRLYGALGAFWGVRVGYMVDSGLQCAHP